MKTALDGLEAIVGRRYVASDAASLAAYAGDMSFVPPLTPHAVVKPGTHADVEAVVAWAVETGTPLVPVSSGPPHFRGDTVPSAPGAVVVELTRMKKILRVDRRNRMVVVEPGVTYPEVQTTLAEQGMRVASPLLPRANKSVVAALLERQPTLIPRYNFHLPEPLRSCGVVWGTGESMFTGEAGNGPPSLEEQWQGGYVQADPKGPGQTDFFRLLTGAQGTMGIVTWASLRCDLLPAAHKLTFVPADRLTDLVALAYRLTRTRLGDELFFLDRSYLARALSANGLSVDAGGLPAWTLILGLGGREHFARERVAVAMKDARRVAELSGLTLRTALGKVPTSAVRAILDGCCESPWKLAARGGSADVFFLTTLDRAGRYVETARELAESLGFSAADLGVYIQPQHQGVSHHVELSLPFDPASPRETAAARRFHDLAGERLIADGAYFSRPYGSWARSVYNRDAASRDALRKVKRIFDPHGVMNPGKLCF
jgi:FAD/FMN-containing dehydrogenase